jgi:hypothetical protein
MYNFAIMKITASLMLVLFVTFISLPTIVGYLNKSVDMSIIYNMSEEEESHKNFKVKEAIKNLKEELTFEFIIHSSKKVSFENHIQYDDVLEEIFSPPPEV